MSIFGNLFDFNGDGHMSIAEQAADYIAFRNTLGSDYDSFDDHGLDDFSFDNDGFSCNYSTFDE